MNRTPVKVVVIGFGAIGRHHARNLTQMPEVDLIGVCDSSEDALAEAERRGYRTFRHLEDAIGEKPQAAVVSIPSGAHHDVTLELVRNGIAVLVEKPIALTLEQGESIIRACSSKAVPLMIGYVERYNPAVLAMREFVSAGKIGTPINVATRRIGALPPRIQDANVLIDIGVHDIDAIAFLTGASLRLVSAQGGRAILKDRIDYASLALDAGGVACHANVNWLTPVKVRDMTVTGTTGYLHLDYLRQEARFAPGRDFELTESFEAVIAQYEDGAMYSLPVVKREPLRVELETFIGGIRGEELPKPEIALESLRIALEATAAIESRQPVNV